MFIIDKPFVITPQDRHEAAGTQREKASGGPVTVSHVVTRAVDVQRAVEKDLQAEKHGVHSYAKLMFECELRMRNMDDYICYFLLQLEIGMRYCNAIREIARVDY